jgi:hypothetical protein
MLAIQRDIVTTTVGILESILTITDALDRIHRLQLEHFCN